MPLPAVPNEPAAVTAYIGIGTNLGDREANIREAIKLLDAHPLCRVAGVSSIHETEPVGPPGQGMYLNAAAALLTTLSAEGLLTLCQGIEDALGRVRTVKWGPRTIDLDILLYGESVIDTGRLKVPHPLMHERRFVLLPMTELAPGLIHPAFGLTVAELLKRCGP